MKKLVLMTILLAGLTIPAATANAGTIYVAPCGFTQTGWTVGARTDDPQRGFTSCRFAWATFRKVRAKERRMGQLPWHFRVYVRQHRLRCKKIPTRFSWQYRCKDHQLYVVLERGR